MSLCNLVLFIIFFYIRFLYLNVGCSSHPAFRLVGRSHRCSSFTHVRRHTPVSSCHFYGMRRIPRLSGASLLGLFRPQSQPMYPTAAIPKRPRLPSPNSGSSLGSDSSSRSVSWGDFPPCKTVCHFTPPSTSVSATATPPRVMLQRLLQPLSLLLQHYLWVSPRHPSPPLSLPLTLMASPRYRANDAVLEPPRPP